MLSANRSAFWIGCLGIIFLLNACGDEEKTDPYPGFSKMVSERQELRKSISKEKDAEKKQAPDAKDIKDEKRGTAPAVMEERQIEITDSASGKTIARGVAYVNKEGKITRITIY